METDKKLQACNETRKVATAALARTLNKSLKRDKVSEKEFSDLWLDELRSCTEIFPSGWYITPPNGLIVLFATAKNPDRVLYPNMRLEETWPRDDVYLDRTDGVLAFYASPVDRESGVIGDMEVMIYLGSNNEVRKTLKTCQDINREIFEYVHVGQQFFEIAKFANKLIDSLGFTNNVLSTTDPQSVNLGHTIPATYDDWTTNEKDILKNGDAEWVRVCQLISKKRIFVNEAENFKIEAQMAFTIEPRLRLKNRSDLPSAWSHSIVLIDRSGAKEQILGFDEIYRICGADYLL